MAATIKTLTPGVHTDRGVQRKGTEGKKGERRRIQLPTYPGEISKGSQDKRSREKKEKKVYDD